MIIFFMLLNISHFIAFIVFMFSLVWTLIERPEKKRWNVVLISGAAWILL